MSAKGVRKTSFRRVKLAPFFNTTPFGSWGVKEDRETQIAHGCRMWYNQISML